MQHSSLSEHHARARPGTDLWKSIRQHRAGFQLAVWFLHGNVGERQSDLVRRVQQMVLKVGSWSNANQAITAAIYRKRRPSIRVVADESRTLG